MPRRPFPFVLLATAAAVAVAALAPPAGAATVSQPDWPAGGYVPSGCGVVVPFVGGVHFTDTTLPRLRTVSWFRSDVAQGATLVIGAGSTGQVSIGGRVTSECSGAGFPDNNPVPPETYTAGVVVIVKVGGPAAFAELLKWPKSTNSWDSVWTSNFVPPITTALVGRYQPILWRTAARYSAFDLSPVGVLGARVPNTPAALKYTTPDVTTPLYILRKSTLARTLNATSVRAGRSVRVTGALKMANGGTYSPVVGGRVYLQRKFGTGSWANVGNGLTNASGGIVFSFTVKRSTYLRLVYNGALSGPFTAPVTTSAVRVRAT